MLVALDAGLAARTTALDALGVVGLGGQPAAGYGDEQLEQRLGCSVVPLERPSETLEGAAPGQPVAPLQPLQVPLAEDGRPAEVALRELSSLAPLPEGRPGGLRAVPLP